MHSLQMAFIICIFHFYKANLAIPITILVCSWSSIIGFHFVSIIILNHFENVISNAQRVLDTIQTAAETKEVTVKQEAKEIIEEVKVKENKHVDEYLELIKNKILNEKDSPKRIDNNIDTKGFRNCKICSKTIKVSNFERHLREIHSGKMRSTCPLCYCKFARTDRLKLHQKSVHKDDLHHLDSDRKPKFSGEDCKFQCQNCNKRFISNSSMNFHNQRMHGTGPLECLTCKRRFVEKYKLDRHKLNCKLVDL